MEWFAMSSKFYADLDDQGISEAAQTLLMRMCGYIAEKETSGFFPLPAIKKLGIVRIPGRLTQLESERIAIRSCEVSVPHNCVVDELSLSRPCAVRVASTGSTVADGTHHPCAIRGWDLPGWPKWNKALEAQVKKKKRDRETVAAKRAGVDRVVRHSPPVSRDVVPQQNRTEQIDVSREVSLGSNAPANEPSTATTPPEPRCPQHLHHPTTAACRLCGDARRARQAWDADHERACKLAISEAARASALERQLAVADCDLCDEDGYIGTTLCDHDPRTTERAQRGIAECRAALEKGSG
ncbi:hypothetical protein ACFTSD_01430 [Nocardiaceae bacterium NPDC056970]